jgi:hypothetical protein
MIGDIGFNKTSPEAAESVDSPQTHDALETPARAEGSWLDQPLLAALNWERILLLLILVLAVVSRFYELGAL